MKIVACNNINSNMKMLQYTPEREKPTSLKSYSVPSDKADEFVKKYNKQAETLARLTGISTFAGVIGGIIHSKNNPKIIPSTLKIAGGAFTGFIVSSFIAYKCNDKLMDRYQVKEYKA